MGVERQAKADSRNLLLDNIFEGKENWIQPQWLRITIERISESGYYLVLERHDAISNQQSSKTFMQVIIIDYRWRPMEGGKLRYRQSLCLG